MRRCSCFFCSSRGHGGGWSITSTFLHSAAPASPPGEDRQPPLRGLIKNGIAKFRFPRRRGLRLCRCADRFAGFIAAAKPALAASSWAAKGKPPSCHLWGAQLAVLCAVVGSPPSTGRDAHVGVPSFPPLAFSSPAGRRLRPFFLPPIARPLSLLPSSRVRCRACW